MGPFITSSSRCGPSSRVPVHISQLNMVAPEHFTLLENCRVGSPELGSMSMMVEPIDIWRTLMKGRAFSDNFGGKVQLCPVRRLR